jgi:hypothetical protein
MYNKNYTVQTSYSREATNAIAERIKRIITIPILAEKLYGDIQLSSHCLSPFRDDRHNSFGVSRDGQLWCDNVTGEGGNVFHFYQKATGCDKRQAFKDLLALAGGEAITFAPLAKASSIIASPKEQFHPELDIPTVVELAQISEIRGISGKALDLAVSRGFLFTSTLKQARAWIITDASRRCYLARRLDGQLWEHINGKAYTLYGSQANWPIGIEEAAGYGAIAMVEGAPDFLSSLHLAEAFTVADLLAPVCMSASSARIPEDALPLFRDKRVRIFVHHDEAGELAAGKWAKQLHGITTKTDGYLFIPPVKDLNELIRSSAEYKQRHRSELVQIMNFVRAN